VDDLSCSLLERIHTEGAGRARVHGLWWRGVCVLIYGNIKGTHYTIYFFNDLLTSFIFAVTPSLQHLHALPSYLEI
jgi:hypothetical protein